MARESLDVTVVVLANRRYSILAAEIGRLDGGGAGPRARSLIDLDRPALDFTALGRGMGVPASSAATADELCAQLERSFTEPGPHLIEAIVPPLFG
jgi:acetolactate synthase-1/2/3 large subunit